MIDEVDPTDAVVVRVGRPEMPWGSGTPHTGDHAVADPICDSGHLAEERGFFSQRGQAGDW
jgi:hypothetical protein